MTCLDGVNSTGMALKNEDKKLYILNGGTATITFNPWQGTIISSTGANVTSLERNVGIYYGGNDVGILSSGNTRNGLRNSANHSAIVYGGNNAGILSDTTVLSRGYLHISSEGSAFNTTISAGGYMYVSSGGIADKPTVTNLSLLSWQKKIFSSLWSEKIQQDRLPLRKVSSGGF